MPRLPSPPNMPPEVQAITDAIGNRVRTEILRLLAANPKTASDLAKQTGGDVTRVRRHLAVLEELGLVIADRPPQERGPGRGRFVLWRTDHPRAEEVGRLWTDYVTGNYPPGQHEPA
jgi:DNA-binding transcriptional ArsR family regulator